MKILFAAIALAAGVTPIAALADDAPLAPFRAEYDALRNGDALGRTTLELTDNHDGTWTLRSETRGTSGLAKLAAIHIHVSQHPDVDAMERTVRALMLGTGARAGLPAGRSAEAFHVVTVNGQGTIAGF